MDTLILLIPLLPILSAVLTLNTAIPLHRRAAKISVTFTALTFLVASVVLAMALAGEQPLQLSFGNGWGILLFDPLSSLMSVVIAGISLIVHLYSVRYMADEAGYARFFVLLDLMTASLLLMVAAGDLITLLIIWHLIGVFLYLLLAHDNKSHSAHRYAFWTLFTYRIGDLPLLLAAGLLYNAYGTWSLTEIFAFVAEAPDAHFVLGMPLLEVVGALVAFSAFARSAQFLLHTWLPYTMAGPTPVSALMHAGIVNAGGFLINRFAPLYMHTSDVLHMVFLVGLITAVVGSVLMLTQNDIKKALGYSTMGQMGFMIMEVGVGAFSLAVYHLIAHGLFKGTLFLSAGGVINEARKDDGVPKHDLYTFVVEKTTAKIQHPWLVMAAITLVIPLLVFVVAHYWVDDTFTQKQGAIVLLFFGWITGAQLIFATYKMHTTNPWRLFGLILLSFVVVVVGYTVISHAFDVFLYPDESMRNQIYLAAGIDLFWFQILMGVVAAIIVIGWIRTYRAEKSGDAAQGPDNSWLNLYALFSREFYVMDLYAGLSRAIVAFAAKLNLWLRWS